MSPLLAENMDEQKDGESENDTEADRTELRQASTDSATTASEARRWRCCAAIKPCGVGIWARCRQPNTTLTR